MRHVTIPKRTLFGGQQFGDVVDEIGLSRLFFYEFGLRVHGKSNPLALSISSKSRRR